MCIDLPRLLHILSAQQYNGSSFCIAILQSMDFLVLVAVLIAGWFESLLAPIKGEVTINGQLLCLYCSCGLGLFGL